MSVSSLDTSVAHSVTVETCVSKLVKLSLERKASSIAVRFSPMKRTIQVVDNGIGFTKYELENILIGDRKSPSSRNIFLDIRSSSDTIIITSRSELCQKTYVKIFRADESCEVFEGYHRPSKGTTVSIRDFNPSQWDGDKNHSISYLVAAMAFMEVEVSFSVRNDDIEKLILDISKPHNSWAVIRSLKDNPRFITNNELHSSDALQDELDGSISPNKLDQMNSFSTNVRLDLSPNIQISNLIRDDIHGPSEWSPWSRTYQTLITTDSDLNYSYEKSIDMSTPIRQLNGKELVNFSQLSVWSDWSYNHESTKNQRSKDSKKKRDPHYKFLPISIYEKLPHKNMKILESKKTIQSSQCPSYDVVDSSKISCFKDESPKLGDILKIKVNHTNLNSDRCKISADTVQTLQVLGQINKEFIATVSYENGKYLLMIMDQHAAHERIRYEYLIETYRDMKSCKFYSVKLDNDLIIPDIDEDLLKLIVFHKRAQSRVGINIKLLLNSTTCAVDHVPKCFLKKIKSYNSEYNQHRLIKNVRELIIEIANGLAVSENLLPPLLPITINNVIAGEACHEAIKFGDPLKFKECISLVHALRDTKAPTRCAHGRPSIIPLLDLSTLKERKSLMPKKLNLSTLRDRIRAKHSNVF